MFESLRTVYLAWRSSGDNPGWFPVGQLDVVDAGAGSRSNYRFGYIAGAERARREAGFTPLPRFPEFGNVYESGELFAVFRNRVMSENRASFGDYLESLDLPPEYREPIHIMALTGGRRRTDSYEVFPKIEPASEGHFELSFFLHGIQYHAGAAERVGLLEVDERLSLVREQTNAGTGLPALRVETLQGEPIGYTPNYMVSDFQYVRENCLYPEQLSVARVNAGNPLDSRVLVNVAGCWPEDYQSMIPEDFRLLQEALLA